MIERKGSMMTLIEKLNARSGLAEGPICVQAAQAISTLTAEVEGLREALRTARDYVADASEGLGPIRTPAGIEMMKGNLALIDATLTKGEGDKP